MPLFIGGISQAALRFALNVRILHCQPRVCLRKFGRTAELVRTAHLASRCKILLLFYRDIASLFPELRHVFAALSLIASFSGLSQAQTVANPPSINFVNNASMPSDSLGIRPAHLWSFDYVKLLWSDTGAVLTAPANWNEVDWMYASFTAAGIGAAASLDDTIKATVQAHRTTGADQFFNRYQNLGAAWSFGVIGAFEIWSEVGGNTTAKNTAMDALTASIIGPGLIRTSLKYAVGRVRPNTAANAFQFKPFSNNQSFPSGHASQAFAVATAIAENYPAWWVQNSLLRRSWAGGLRSDRTKRPLCERRRRWSASRLGGRPCNRASPQWLSAQSRKTELESLRRRRRCSPRVFQVVLIDAVPAYNIRLPHARYPPYQYLILPLGIWVQRRLGVVKRSNFVLPACPAAISLNRISLADHHEKHFFCLFVVVNHGERIAASTCLQQRSQFPITNRALDFTAARCLGTQ